ncbi:CRISPR-associated endoribonuclease Cas6 [Lutispora thermophila]|uniref:CRISPR-associated endoribonuclease n=1 Tax=Lutispora thermophila DSM 19022 TaxID=1122184 RepID=A0A1M6E9M9_9FIRM|nr:CRISPR-associated endoribonuclease Cas6 [Lutispora thermophila]SHI81988.1 CRISPR-associated endoribonuclease Cas6 [Lutispora thermophila DSM 19022]
MQIRVSFTSENDIVLPIHYNNIVQAFIYDNIDKNLSNFLHDKGYISNSRAFKMFSFSRIIGKSMIKEDKINFGTKIQIIASSPLDDFCKSIANNMLQSNYLFIGKNSIRTEQIEINNQLVTEDKIVVNTLSPIVVYSTLLKPDNRKYTCYFMPREPDFNRLIRDNLIKKYNALTNERIESDIEVIPLGPVKQNLTYYKGTIIKGASGKFLIKGNKKLLQMGVDAGFGSKNSQGFGCVKVI